MTLLEPPRVFALLLAVVAGAGCGGRALVERDAGRDAAPREAAAGGDAADSGPSDLYSGLSDVAAEAPDVAPDAPTRDGGADADAGGLDAGAAFVNAVESFCAERAHHNCARLVNCQQASEDMDDCLVDDARSCATSLEDWQVPAATRGQLVLDAAAVAACFAALDELPCDQAPAAAECSAVLAGLAPDGAPCAHAEMCRSGFCDLPFYGACSGTCRSLPTTGAPCTPSSDPSCDPSTAFCDLATNNCVSQRPRGATCTEGDQCRPADFCQRPPGGDCTAPDGGEPLCHCVLRRVEGQSCAAYVDCEPGLACVDGACRKPGGRGDLCDTELVRSCEGALVCIIEPGAPTGTCGDRLPAGASCAGDVCRFGTKCARPNADVGGVCRGIFELGHTCEGDDDCALDAYCGAAHVCTARPHAGETCSGGAGGGNAPCWGSNLVCAAKLGPVDGTHICEPPPTPGLGERCVLFRCAAGLVCFNGSCVTPWPAGAPCDNGDVGNACASGICQVPGPALCGDLPCPGTCTETCRP